jgi:hypothetical protein
MKQFIKRILIFFIPVIIVLCSIELFLRTIPNDYKYKKERLINQAQDIQILVLGSSHAHYGIDPNYFSMDGFNFANISQSLDIDNKLLEKYGDKLAQLKYVVIPISYSTLFSTLSTGNENWRIKNYTLYYNINIGTSFSFGNYFELLNGTMLSNAGRLYKYIKDQSKLITVSDKGFGLNYSSNIKNDMERTGKAAALRHTHFDTNIFSYNKNILDQIINWCKTKNVKLVFITFPAYYTYKNKLDNNQLQETINYMNLIEKRNNNVYYFNLLNENGFVQEDFFDADHLNEVGAGKLTKKINNILLDIK